MAIANRLHREVLPCERTSIAREYRLAQSGQQSS